MTDRHACRNVSIAFVALVLIFAAAVFAPKAFAGGSDSPTPYTVSVEGITLPAGVTFPDNGHVNIKVGNDSYGIHLEGKCVNRTDAECEGKRHNDAQYIGKEFIPWDAFGSFDPCSVSWVQISMYNEHWGEGKHPPLCSSPEPTPTTPPTTPPSPEPSPEPSSGPETPTPEPTSTPPTTPTPEPSPSVPTTPTQPEPQPSSSPSPTSAPTSSTPPVAAPQEPEASQKVATPTHEELAATGFRSLMVVFGAAMVLIVGGALIRKGYPPKP